MSLHEVEIYEFLLIKIVGCDVLEDVGKQGRHIFTEGHRHNGPLDSLLAVAS
jgi:hypothetical protein